MGSMDPSVIGSGKAAIDDEDRRLTADGASCSTERDGELPNAATRMYCRWRHDFTTSRILCFGWFSCLVGFGLGLTLAPRAGSLYPSPATSTATTATHMFTSISTSKTTTTPTSSPAVTKMSDPCFWFGNWTKDASMKAPYVDTDGWQNSCNRGGRR
eukprot:TRINITY_DN61161_c0_g1_i1.p1 TRINITY_DN61161_c0_g1~~TRINITY_DN61161_c0_g1_i1.p1  ORF type:complete len:157 (-),score=15.00 TRINITY_DN61161_c0_g1_i1:717-1187(-)